MRNRNNNDKFKLKFKIFRDMSKTRLQPGNSSEQQFFKIIKTPNLPTIYEEPQSNVGRFEFAYDEYYKKSENMQNRVGKRQNALFRKYHQKMTSIPEENTESIILNTNK